MKKVFFLASLVLVANNAEAATLDSTNGDWSVYSEGKKNCYIASVPNNSDGNFKKRDQPYVLVSSKSKNSDEINVSSGYPYKPNVHVELSIDGKKYRLFSQDEVAWAKSAADDKAIVTAMKSGAKLEVKALSTKGSYSTDTYSLKGVGAAYKRMKELCK